MNFSPQAKSAAASMPAGRSSQSPRRSGFGGIASSWPTPGLVAQRPGLVGAAGWARLTKFKFGCEPTAYVGPPQGCGKLIQRLEPTRSQTSPPSPRLFPRHL